MMNLAIVALLAVPGQLVATSTAKPTDRQRFADAMKSIPVGHTQSQVAAILGQPDDVVTHADGGFRMARSIRKVWVYGTDGHLTFPTLGCIYFGRGGRVAYVFGAGEVRLPPNMVDETDLRSLLVSVDRIGGLKGGTYNPLWLIQAANRLRDLGKEGALSVIEEYSRVASGMTDTKPTGLLILMRVLFEVPEEYGAMPNMGVGRTIPHLGYSKDMRKALPRFPILLSNDIPLLLVSGYVSLGGSRSLKLHLEYFRKDGRLGKEALRPPDNPLKIRAELTASRGWSTFSQLEQSDPAMVKRQLMRMLDGVPAARKLLSQQSASALGSDDQWEKLVDDLDQLEIRWDARLNRYRRGATNDEEPGIGDAIEDPVGGGSPRS
ncbi:MAG: hypothetical protein ACYSWU_08665 [Planctomycetota bacterium]|jgi:hypothetical protein